MEMKDEGSVLCAVLMNLRVASIFGFEVWSVAAHQLLEQDKVGFEKKSFFYY